MAILALGSILVDRLCPVPYLPVSGGGVISEGPTCALGGTAYNTAMAIRGVGGSCFLFAPLGTGPNADFIRTKLAKLCETATPCAALTPAGVAPQATNTFPKPGAAPTAQLGYTAPAAQLGNTAATPQSDNTAPTAQSGIAVAANADNGSCVCLLEPNGERTMITLRGVEAQFCDEWFEGFDAAPYRYAITCGYELLSPGAEAILRFYERNRHMTLVFAPGPCVETFDAATITRINALHPMWHLNAGEALRAAAKFAHVPQPVPHEYNSVERAGRALALACGNAVIITDGHRGCYAFLPPACAEATCSAGGHAAQSPYNAAAHEEDISVLHVPTTPITPISTIGAGDAHVGVLFANLEAGKSWEESMAAANAYAARVCLVPGATLYGTL